MTRSFSNIAVVLKKYRIEANISQTKLAKRSGYLNGQFISNVERGLCSIPAKQLPKVLSVLEENVQVNREDFVKAMTLDFEANVRSLAGEFLK